MVSVTLEKLWMVTDSVVDFVLASKCPFLNSYRAC